MLKERTDVRQIGGEGYRRWFSDTFFDLIVWYEDETLATCIGFQLCYDKEGTERALTWSKEHSYSHTRVDDGEIPFSNKMSPILVSDGIFDTEEIKRRFIDAAGSIEKDVVSFVVEKLDSYK